MPHLSARRTDVINNCSALRFARIIAYLALCYSRESEEEIRGKKNTSHLCDCEKLACHTMKLFRVLNPYLSGQVARGSCALAVMTKAPLAGQVKTRLVPPLTADDAAKLNKCFLLDTATAISNAIINIQARGVAVYT